MNESDEEDDEEEFTDSKDLYDDDDKFWFNSLKWRKIRKILYQHYSKHCWKLIKRERQAYTCIILTNIESMLSF